MKYTIQGLLIFDTKAEAEEVFELIKTHQSKFRDMNTKSDWAEETTDLKLIECDHDEPSGQRKGSKVLKEIKIEICQI